MTVKNGIVAYGTPLDEGAWKQIENCKRSAAVACLMADHHQGYGMPIGGVCAYEGKIAPAGVGYDIACGNKAVRLNLRVDDFRQDLPQLMDEIWSRLSFGMGLNNAKTVDHELFDDDAWSQVRFLRSPKIRQIARNQLGTIGSGNHYVDLFEDETGRCWIGVHFGSRGLGHKIATHFLTELGSSSDMFAEPATMDADSALGVDYLAAMRLAGRYAYAGRDWVCDEVASILQGTIEQSVHNHHNFAWHETHDGRDYWVVRKGATPAFPGQLGFVGGSMGETSVILEGVESEASKATLYSTVHGAGRVMSRTQAAGKLNRKTGERSGGVITREMMDTWMREQGVQLRGGGLDESPHCYKRLTDVLAEHGDTIRVLHRLKPVGVCMAGANEFDPYKD